MPFVSKLGLLSDSFIAFGLLASLPAHAAACHRYDERVVLEGSVVRQTFPGPPNYESVADGDKAMTLFVLRLSKPACFEAEDKRDSLYESAYDVTDIQLSLPSEQAYATLRPLLGKPVRLAGSAFGRHTGGHFTPVLLEKVELLP